MKRVCYKSPCYDERNVQSVYIGYRLDDLIRYEVNKDGFTVKESIVDPMDYDIEKVNKADSLKRCWPKQVKIWGSTKNS